MNHRRFAIIAAAGAVAQGACAWHMRSVPTPFGVVSFYVFSVATALWVAFCLYALVNSFLDPS